MDHQTLIQSLQLAPHPEGGFYRETYRSQNEGRAHGTAILYLLPGETFSAWHRVDADEIWHFHSGGPLDLHLISPDGEASVLRLGPHAPQGLVPAGWWQAAHALGPEASLCGCTVHPGFEFAGFEMPPREVLAALFPQHLNLIERFTR